jgi:hypothetical protein
MKTPITFSCPRASNAIQAVRAESIPPESPIVVLEKQFFLA